MKNKGIPLIYYKTIFLLSGCMILVGVLYWESLAFKNFSVKKVSDKLKIDDKNFFDNLLEYQNNLLTRVEYENITNSPIFIEGRIGIKHNGSLNSTESSEFKLTGVILHSNTLLALIQDKNNNQFRLKLGEQANGWTVISVHNDSVELRKDDQIQNLWLIEPKNSPETTLPENFDIHPRLPEAQNIRDNYKSHFY